MNAMMNECFKLGNALDKLYNGMNLTLEGA